MPPMPGAPVVSANTVQDELKRAFRRGLGASRAVARFKKPVRDKQQQGSNNNNNNNNIPQDASEKAVGKDNKNQIDKGASKAEEQGVVAVENVSEDSQTMRQVAVDENVASKVDQKTSQNGSSGIQQGGDKTIEAESSTGTKTKETSSQNNRKASGKSQQQKMPDQQQVKRARPLKKQFSLQIEPSCDKITNEEVTSSQLPDAKSALIYDPDQTPMDVGASYSTDSSSPPVEVTQCKAQVLQHQQQTRKHDAKVVNNDAVHIAPVGNKSADSSSCDKMSIPAFKTDTDTNDTKDTHDRRHLGKR